MNRQLVLEIQQNYQANFSNFCWGNNVLLQKQLQDLLQLKADGLLYIWGDTGCGKSHLLQASCQFVAAQDRQTAYLPLNLLKEWGPLCLEGMEHHHLIAIDDIDCIAGNNDWEEALFHLFNKIKDQENSLLLLASKFAPQTLAIKLADLRSRLFWGLVFHLEELNDELKIKSLQNEAAKRGFELSDNVAMFLINRCTRNMHNLLQILNQLDIASLSAKRKITIPFVKAALNL